MDLDRFNKELILKGTQAQFLKDTPIFFEAVSKVLNKYAELEENILTSEQHEVREIGAKVKHYATMRKCTLDIINELDEYIFASEAAREIAEQDDDDGLDEFGNPLENK